MLTSVIMLYGQKSFQFPVTLGGGGMFLKMFICGCACCQTAIFVPNFLAILPPPIYQFSVIK